MQGTLTWLARRVDAHNAALEGNAAALRSMTELPIKALLASGQLLLDEQERAFMASCDMICLITDAEGWPNIRVLDPKAVALEVVNSRVLRLHLVQPVRETAKVALVLTRYSDGQHLTIHGHVASRIGQENDEVRVRISVASLTWSPKLSAGAELPIARALSA